MSRDIGEAYRRAVAIATDDHNVPARLEAAVEVEFGLDDNDVFDVWCREFLIRHVGLVFCPVTLDGHGHFDVPSLYQGPTGWPAWILPVRAWGAGEQGEPLIEDLVAWCPAGKHAGKVWTMMGYAVADGLDVPEGQRSLKVFTQPKLWLLYWLKVVRDRARTAPGLPAPWPDQVAALVLDPKRICWKPVVKLHSDVPLTVETIDFADSPELRDYCAKVMRLEMPPMPRLRAVKPTSPEIPHGPTSKPAKPVVAATAGARADR